MIALIIVAVVVAGFVVAGIICFRAFALPAMRPLEEEDRAICSRLVKQGKAYPFLCAYSIKRRMCPCQPCPMVAAARDSDAVQR